MKRLFPLLIIAFLFTDFYAQNQVDALRLTQTFPGGTARSVAMGGAFGALGGDTYSASVNPAGMGVYRKSELTISPEVFYNSVTTRLNGSSRDDYKTNFNLNNFGYVSSFKINSGNVKGGSFGVGYNKINNFTSQVSMIGTNTESSLADYFAETANIGEGNGPVGLDQLLPYSEGLFYDGFIMDRGTDGSYFVNPLIRDSVTNTVNVAQDVSIEKSGKMNEWYLSLGFNVNHVFYFGGSLSIIPVEYDEFSSFIERGADDNAQYFNFHETLKVRGTGYSGKFGVIIRPIQLIRIGLSYHLPTVYSLIETTDADLNSRIANQTFYPFDGNDNLDYNSFEYSIRTPGKAVGSLALMLNKSFLVSTDVEFINYKGMSLGNASDGSSFSDVNSDIDDIYKANVNIKTGAEFRLEKLYLRGGFGYYGSPYADNEPNANAYQTSYSAGIGFRGESNFIDFAVSYKSAQEDFVLYGNPLPPVVANVKTESLKFMTTIGFRF